MDETRLRTIAQLEEFLSATPQVAFSAHDEGEAGDNQRDEHISRVLARFGCPSQGSSHRLSAGQL